MIKLLKEIRDLMVKQASGNDMIDKIDTLIDMAAPKKKKKKKRKPLCTAAFLTNEGQNDLKDWWESNIRDDLLARRFMHHMTIKFKPSAEEVMATPIGQEVELVIAGFGKDYQGQAVAVVTNLPVAAEIPHITVSTAEGVSPVYSNELLQTNFKEISGPSLKARIGYWNGKEAIYDFPVKEIEGEPT